jgi:adenylate cyclase
MSKAQCRLAAIVAADVVGYLRLMGADETGTLAALRSHGSELIDPLIRRHGGRIVTPWATVCCWSLSVVAAVEFAIATQTGLAERNQRQTCPRPH